MRTITKIEPQIPQIPTRKRVAAYARVSVDSEQLLHSLSAQVSYYSNLIQKNPQWEYAGVYADEGISGTGTAKRKEFLRLIADCDAGKIDLILVKSVSRFARNTVDSLTTIRELKNVGCECYFEKENIWTLDSKGDVLPSEMIQCNDRSTGLKPLGIWALGRWLPLGSLLFFPEIGGRGAVWVHTLLTMNTLLTIAWGIVKRVWAIVNTLQNITKHNKTVKNK